jgi:hypothetical protein
MPVCAHADADAMTITQVVDVNRRIVLMAFPFPTSLC